MTLLVIIPACIALCFKILFFYLYYAADKKTRLAQTFAYLLITLSVCNALEIYGYFHTDQPEKVYIFLKIYYVSLVLLFAFLIQFSFESAFGQLSYRWDLINILISGSLCLYLLMTSNVIAGVESIGYSVTRVPGTHYWLMQLYTLTSLTLSLAILVWGYKRNKHLFYKIRCLYILFAVAALAFPVITAIVFMAMGFKVNAAIILPIGVTLHLAIILYATTRSYLSDLRIYIPFTVFWKLRQKSHQLFHIFETGETYDLDEAKKIIEHNMVLSATQNFAHLSDRQIAKILGKSPSWLSSKKKELKIK